MSGSGFGSLGVDDGLADHDVVNAGNGHDVAGACGFDRDTLEALGAQQFGDAEVLEGAVHTGQAVGLALLQRAVVDTDQAESSEEVGGVDVGHVSLQRAPSSYSGAGMVEMMVSNSGSRLSLSGRPPSAGWFTEA